MKLFLLAFCSFIRPGLTQQSVWGQCGGKDWTGSTTCVSGTTCTYQNDFYSQCLPGGGQATTLTTKSASSSASSTSSGQTQPSSSGSFSWDRNNFYVNGQKFQIIGGQIDPQRVPRANWADRLQMAKSMGLNTIFFYLYWQEIEKYQGKFDFSDRNDIASWVQEIQKAGLKAVLRPGPYVCAERDWGGLPGWLSQISGMRIRSNNQPFLDASGKYLAKVGEQLRPYLISNGGPILMTQIENEYGYVGNDHSYTNALANLLKTSFPGTKLYTNDGATEGALKSGQVPGALSVIDGTDSRNGFSLRDRVITDQSSLGPLVNGEYWIRWFDSWGPRNGHSTYDGDTNGKNNRASELDWILSGGNHFSIFMFHGGTSWEFGNGAGDNQPRPFFTTSYDYGSPLDETGRPSQIYTDFRNAIAKHVPSIPAVPSLPGLQTIGDFNLVPVRTMFESPPDGITSNSPKLMEATGQVFGYLLYEYVASGGASGNVNLGSGGPRDRVIVYVNGIKKGVIDAIYKNPATVNVALNNGDKLWLLVENMGRVDNGFSDQTKGILGDVSVGNTKLSGWKHYNYPLDETPGISGGQAITVASNGPPVWYRGTFSNSNTGLAGDTFLQLPGGIKGVVFVNGHNIGRYWTIGPQQELFLPGAFLKQGSSNEVLVLELEPSTSSRVARGVSRRTWKNNPDPDCNNCS